MTIYGPTTPTTMEVTTYKIKCRNCDKEVFFSDYQRDSKECQKSRCWLKTLKARTEAAVLKGCNAEDFIAPVKGVVKMHEEPKAEVKSYNQATGRWVNNRWVPWGTNVDDMDCY